MIRLYATLAVDHMDKTMPTDAGTAYLLPASSWARPKYGGIDRPVRFPAGRPQGPLAADCGGYVATKVWGDYRYTPAQYVKWLESFGPDWAATMDYCCEPDIAVSGGVTRERQDRTTEMAHRFFKEYRSCSWAWCPTVQGWHIEDYRRHAQDLKPLVYEMAEYYGGSEFRVGIGTLCQRANARMIREVVKAVTRELPGIPLHLWGVKTAALSAGDESLPGAVVSTDSAAWNGFFGTGIEEWRESGMTRRAYSFQVALPRYLDNYNAGQVGKRPFCGIEQLSLFAME